MNTKVPSLKDPGKEYDGFTITITGDKYVSSLGKGIKGAGVGKQVCLLLQEGQRAGLLLHPDIKMVKVQHVTITSYFFNMILRVLR